MYFLAHNSLYKEVKPHRFKYAPPAGLSETNIHVEEHEVSIHDVRQHGQALDLQKDGFALIPMTSAMTYEDFEDEKKIKEIYLKELAEGLKTSLNASRVQRFEHLVRDAGMSAEY
jgi:hypothetical protein